MTRLRIAFLLPRYSAHSKSQLVRAMQILSERGVTVDIIHPTDRVIDLATIRVEHDLHVLKKKHDLPQSLAGALHALGATIVNPYPASLALHDKIVTGRILQAAGVLTPATYVVSQPGMLAPLLETGPLVVKPYRGSSGYGVRVVRTAAELPIAPDGKDPVFAQRYHPPEGRDRKIYVIGDRLFGVKKVFPARTEAEKYGEPFVPGPELCEITRRCGQAFGIDLYGVDVVESEGRAYVVDMSSIPGFKGVPDAPQLLADYFHKAAKRAAGGRPLLEEAAIR
jgi:ribosomal protein S6--L-glutamate ligase